MSKLQAVAGYGPYRVDKDGVPFLNDVVRDFLGKCDISAEEFGKRLGRLSRPSQREYTKGRISQMLQDNSFPREKPRRWVIAKLLQIPPVLMGVTSLDDLLVTKEQPVTASTIQSYHTIPQEFDIKEYRHSLSNYSLTNHTHTVMGVIAEINQRICFLEQETIYGDWKGKGRRSNRELLQLVHLLCQYHILFANVSCDHQRYETAIIHLNKAYRLAKNYMLVDTQAAILSWRGWVYNEQGCAHENVLDFNTARTYFTLAKNDFLAERELKDKLCLGLRGYIHLDLGLALSHLATNSFEIHQAVLEMEKAKTSIGKDVDKEDVYFMSLDEERYHLDVAEIYISAPIEIACYPRDARRELRNAFAARADSKDNRRKVFYTVLKAKSYLIDKEYEEATKTLLEALAQAKTLNSKVNIARIFSSCNRLLTTDYGKKSVDVAELEVALMTMQHPEFFQ